MIPNYALSSTSEKRLYTCHEELVTIAETSLSRSLVDFGIAQGERSKEQQLKYFKDDKSTLDPRNDADLAKAKHIVSPEHGRLMSHAMDIYAWVDGSINWDRKYYMYLAGIIQSVSLELYKNGIHKYMVRWGGNWDSDGIISDDQTFDDLVHFELANPSL